MFQERSQYDRYAGNNSWKMVALCIAAGFGVGTLLSLPTTLKAQASSIDMAAVPTKMALSMQPAKAGLFMQPVKTRQIVQPVSASLDEPEEVAHTQASSAFGRRKAMAAAFALAGTAAGKRASAEENTAERYELVYGQDNSADKTLPPAGDFTSYNSVVTKKLPERASPGLDLDKNPGSVGTDLTLVPGVIAFTALAAAGVPALLSPGQTAKDAQDAQSGGKPRRKTR